MPTKLSVVGDVMTRLGRRPVKTLDTGGSSTQGLVERVMDETIDSILGRGWWFNQRIAVALTADGANEFPVATIETGAPQIYTVKGVGTSSNRSLGIKDDKIFDHDTRTTTFGGSLVVTYSYQVPFEDIPFAFTRLIAAQTAIAYLLRYPQRSGLQARDISLQRDLADAWAVVNREENETSNANILDTSEATQIRGRPRTPDRSVY